jgi:hypothetical protein
MIGRRYWILIWYGILAVGMVGLIVAAYWGRRTRWTNLDEVLRAVGTITVSCGMLLLLYGIAGAAAQTLLVASLFAFVMAFILGRRDTTTPPGPDESEEDESE